LTIREYACSRSTRNPSISLVRHQRRRHRLDSLQRELRKIKPPLNVRHTRWMKFLSEYNFEIKNIKGKEKKVVDALNRRVHKMHATTISMYRTNLKDRIL
jgi:hypothetical protein